MPSLKKIGILFSFAVLSLLPAAADRGLQQVSLAIIGMTTNQVEKEYGPPVTRATFSQDQIQETGPDFHYFKKAWFPGRVLIPASARGETWFYDTYGFSVTFSPEGKAQGVCIFLSPIQKLTTGAVFSGAEGYFPISGWSIFSSALRNRILQMAKTPVHHRDDRTFSIPIPVYRLEDPAWIIQAFWPEGSDIPALVTFVAPF